MDMKCLKCRELWDWWYIRDEVLENEELYQKMKSEGGYVKDNSKHSLTYEVYKVSPNPLLGKKKRSIEEVEKIATWQFTPGPIIAQCPNCIGKEIKLSE